MNPAHLPEPPREAKPDCSKLPTTGPSFWMRLGRCRYNCKHVCCVFFRNMRSSGWEAITPPMWMCGSSLRPIRICTGRWRRVDSAKPFITASASCPYISRRFATGARISRSCSVFLWSNDRSNLRSPLLYAVFSSHIPGREIYGNCAILWNISRFLANPSWGQRIFRAAVRRYLSQSRKSLCLYRSRLHRGRRKQRLPYCWIIIATATASGG